MHISRILLAGAAIGTLAGMTIPPASAAVMTVGQVTRDCPDIDRATACPALAERFLADRPTGPTSDGQIITLVLTIADLAQQPRVTMPVCLNAAEGLLVLAGGVSDDGQASQVRDIADSLCDGARTAAIRRGPLFGDGTGTGNGNGGSSNGGTTVIVGNNGGGGAGDDDDDGNNGHGNDPEGSDPSNPGKSDKKDK